MTGPGLLQLSPVRVRKGIKMITKVRKGIPFYLMIVPVLVVLGVLFVYPLVRVFYLSFFSYSPIYGIKFLGWHAYYEVLTDRIFIEAVFRNLLYVGVVVGANLLIGMGYALLTYKAVKGIRILRTILVLPILFIPAVTAVTWSLLYNEQIGLINHFLMVMGFTRRMWLASGKTAFPAVMITDIWGWTPFVYLVLLAGLQSLPTEPLEAAEIDGASSWQKFVLVLLPMMKPVIAIAIIIKSMDAYRTFVFMWVMTRGGPGDSTQVLSTLIYDRAFRHFKYGLSSTMSVVTFLIAAVLSISLITTFKTRSQ